MYAERRLQATCDLAETCLALDDPQAAVELAERALVLDPLFERAHRVAIVGHMRARRGGPRPARLRALPGDAARGAGHHARAGDGRRPRRILRREDPGTLIAAPPGPGAEVPAAPPGSTGTRYAQRRGEPGVPDPRQTEAPMWSSSPGSSRTSRPRGKTPPTRAFMRGLATDRRLIIFDKRGTGLSDSVVEWPTFAERVDDMFAVMDAAGSGGPCCSGCRRGARCVRWRRHAIPSGWRGSCCTRRSLASSGHPTTRGGGHPSDSRAGWTCSRRRGRPAPGSR